MQFSLEINLGNDEMRTGYDVANLLEQIAEKLHEGFEYDVLTEPTILNCSQILRDINGNQVGTFTVLEK